MIKFKGFDTVEEVRFLLKKELFVGEDDLPPRKRTNTTTYQLIGLEADHEQGQAIGKVRMSCIRGQTTSCVVRRSGILVPMTEDHVTGHRA